MIHISQIIQLADAYQRANPIKDTTLSHRIFKDTKKIAFLRAGQDLTTARFAIAVCWFYENWPDGANWPTGMPVPSPTEIKAFREKPVIRVPRAAPPAHRTAHAHTCEG